MVYLVWVGRKEPRLLGIGEIGDARGIVFGTASPILALELGVGEQGGCSLL